MSLFSQKNVAGGDGFFLASQKWTVNWFVKKDDLR